VSRRAFTLVELLLVISIIAIAMSMVFVYVGKRDIRGMQVRVEAEHLADVLREVRGMAIDRKGVYGVAFNIANGKGTSGHVLNNRDGGHWYRVIGPSRSNSQMGNFAGYGGYSYYLRYDPGWYAQNQTHDVLVGGYLEQIKGDFIGERQVLPKGQVRFLALADQDNGNNRGRGFYFGPSYPRPWFGTWDSSTHRLYAWGGYDPELKDFAQHHEWWTGDGFGARVSRAGGLISYTGFYFEGSDGQITGCQNPVDRMIPTDTNASGNADPADLRNYQLLKKDDVRPVVNADWLDALILFYPDGTARYEDWMHVRHALGNNARNHRVWRYWNELDDRNVGDLGMGDMCNECNTWEFDQGPVPYNMRYEASHYVARTGSWYITLAPDSADDRSTFPTPESALASISPMVRVGISRLGEVSVLPVKRHQTAGTVLDDVHVDGWWQNRPCGMQGYEDNVLTTADGPCMPVEDFVTPAMLEHHQWWLKP
jgi:prepilin-type N-terminal cleavage/methylation domain-containing protein